LDAEQPQQTATEPAERLVDAVVIGAGPAGEVAAGKLAEGGLEVALIEDDLVGGECSFYACMPSKALLRPGQVLAEARRVAGAAEAVTGELDAGATLARRDEIVHGLDDSAQMPWLEKRGIELFRGHGRLSGERTVQVGGQTLKARQVVVLATGSVASIPPVPGLEESSPWSNREATTAKRVPVSLLVLGGGVVGVEMAWAYSSLGSKVTLVESAERLIGGEEPFASELVQEGLAKRGVEVILGAKATGVHRDGEGSPVCLELDSGGCREAEEILVAAGRRPLSDDLGLETVGVEPGGYVEVDETLRVAGREWLYVVGDLNGKALLTHVGKHQARMAAARILGNPLRPSPAGEIVPRVIFTEPQVAAVGHTLASAGQAGIEVREARVSLQGNAGSSFIGHDAGGCASILVDERREVIVAEVPLWLLAQATPSFPTRSEVWLGLLEEAGVKRAG
jgi:pyruvate/2-oxoglutarate dehydrogenase complex dihydrolipoamide dehydrogenase (E3) component